ncbi:MAG: ABC transporter permease [Ruminococcus sp.]|nr:ABC transporter permease [Ruminococcus sp.]
MFGKIIKLSFKSIFNNKMRSFLTMLGIIIGVMAVVILVSITQGTASGITSSISDMGSDAITAQITDEDVTITYEDLESLEDNRFIESVSPIITTTLTVKKNSTSSSYSIKGVTQSYFNTTDIAIQSGRIVRASDDEYSTKVAVIGTDVATDLFGTWDAVGGTITVDDQIYTVIGVLEEEGSSLTGSDNSSVLIPYSTAAKVTGSSAVTTFYAKSTSSDTVESAVSYIENYLYRLTSDEDAFR